MVDNSTQTPRDEDSGKPEEEVTIEEDDATGTAPDNPEQADKEGKFNFQLPFAKMFRHSQQQHFLINYDCFQSTLSHKL